MNRYLPCLALAALLPAAAGAQSLDHRRNILVHNEGAEMRIFTLDANCQDNRIDIRPDERLAVFTCLRIQDRIEAPALASVPQLPGTRPFESLMNWNVVVNLWDYPNCHRIEALPAEVLPEEVRELVFDYVWLCKPGRIHESSFEQ
jgi:hypothetical protein